MDSAMMMPGSFMPDCDHHPIRPALTRAIANSSSFNPPQSTSAASSLSSSLYTTARTNWETGNGSRKRPRVGTNASTFVTPRMTHDSLASLSSFDNAPSPSPFVNTNYHLAGGLDTPTAALERDDGQDESFLNDLRPNRFTSSAAAQQPDYFPQTPALLDRERNGRKRAYSDPDTRGWSNTVWTATSGLAGKVLSFCWNTAFHGFHTGPGRTYQMSDELPAISLSQRRSSVGEKDDVFCESYHRKGGTPGAFPVDGLIEDYMSHPQAYHDTELSTPTQNLNGEGGMGSTLKGTWVMLNQSDIRSRETSPVRQKQMITQEQTHSHRRAHSRASMPSRPSIAGSRQSTTTASFASPRAGLGNHPVLSPSRPTSYTGPPQHRRSRSSIAAPRHSPVRPPQHERRGSMISNSNHSNSSPAIPVSPEVKQFQKKMRRKERAADEKMTRLNEQLFSLIRQGKEALGTTVDIDVEDEDGRLLMFDEGYAGSDREY